MKLSQEQLATLFDRVTLTQNALQFVREKIVGQVRGMLQDGKIVSGKLKELLEEEAQFSAAFRHAATDWLTENDSFELRDAFDDEAVTEEIPMLSEVSLTQPEQSV